MNGELKMNGIGNGPVAAMAFGASFVVGGADILVRLLVMLVVALLGKVVDVLVKNRRTRRREQWRQRAVSAERELRALKTRLKAERGG